MNTSVPVDLSDLKTQLDAWRQSHRKHARIPDHFYKIAVTLLDRYSVLLSVTRRACVQLRSANMPPRRVPPRQRRPS